METFREIFSEVLRDGLVSRTSGINSSVGSEFRQISTTVPARFKVFSESAFMAVRDYGS
jgi:hypothetical protein